MEKFPEFELENQDGEVVSNNTLTGTTVLYFYPKDNTPGCTTQACDMRDSMADLNELGVTVYGISGDSKQKHKNFIEKNNLNFDLLVDEDFKLSNELGVYGLKKAFGKEFNGISRTTFVIDKDSNILKRFDDVKPKEHADELKSFLKEG
ncbi:MULTISPECIES: thioredoxin-dependent thiol peroxidase [Jeotgalicoccus]|uniref:thioredoxin-dependent thiol peroxidase n=1 Tax=Jeotgalicoccus TaxID=227979 RepID=UPI0004159309|nr:MULTISPECIES: thioredoxin-dependent thiol peroxidase [Jeotgalicoccus]QQD85092.1 thioredoxin-dependent thiol peroxidase [Jeotgalicoccus sp. ATCC 8456]